MVDASTPDPERRIAAVRSVLDEIGLESTPELLVFNQIDRLAPEVARALAARYGAVAVSAIERTGLEELLAQAEALLFRERDAARDKAMAAKIA